MAVITWEDVGSLATELAGEVVQPIAQEAILAVANDLLDPATWGGEDTPKLRLARIYYAAHLATMGRFKGRPGALTSEAAGGLSKGYANPMLGYMSTLSLTSYGLMFIALARTTGARAGIVLNGGALRPVPSGWDG